MSFSFTSLLAETRVRTSRSSGSGGQGVNKLETRVELIFNVNESQALSPAQKRTVLQRLSNRLNTEDEIVVASQTYRSQSRNKKDAEERLIEMLQKALRPIKKRIATKISRAKKEARLKEKKKRSETKSNRRKGGEGEY